MDGLIVGTNFFNGPKQYKPPSFRAESSAVNAGRSAANSAGNAAQKNLANAAAMGRFMKQPLKPLKTRKKV